VDFSAFAAVESSRARQQEERQEQFEIHYLNALDYLMRFQDKNCFHQPYLQKAVHELLAAIPHQRGRVEPYAWLAYAMYVLEKDILFKDYFQIAYSIDSEYQLVIALKNISAKPRPLVVSSQPSRGLRRSRPVENKKPVHSFTREKTVRALESTRASETEAVFSGDFNLQDI